MPDRTKNQTSAINSPHELALGVAIGALIGLMPKDSAIPWLLGLLLLVSRGNLLCGVLTVIAASLISPLFDPITDPMGASLLSVSFMQSQYAAWMELPWMAWTRFNNTVVAGSLLLGVIAALPVYLLGQVFFRSWGIRWIEQLMETRAMCFIFGRPSSYSQSSESSPVAEA